MSLIQAIHTRVRDYLDVDRRKRIRKFQGLHFRLLQHILLRCLFRSNLKALALLYGTDKWGGHWYAQHYEQHFFPLRGKRLNILEIGIGGSEDPEAGGASLRMWRTYFPYSRIYGIDIFDKHVHDERRIRTFRGSQTDESFLNEVVREIGNIHIIIDDGSHYNQHVLHTFAFLFRKLHQGGIYVIEDTQTSYWPDQGGSSLNLNGTDTTMGFLKTLVDGLNYAEFDRAEYNPTYYDRYITAMHFYHNIVFIQKGFNNEGTYTISKGEWNKPW
jgi:hypothetical protein